MEDNETWMEQSGRLTYFERKLLCKLDELICALKEQPPEDFDREDKIVRAMTAKVHHAKKRIPTGK